MRNIPVYKIKSLNALNKFITITSIEGGKNRVNIKDQLFFIFFQLLQHRALNYFRMILKVKLLLH